MPFKYSSGFIFDKQHRNIEYNIDKNNCHNCISHKPNNNGYPTMRFFGKTTSISRFVFEDKFGEILKGMQVCHTCDNRLCINPDHFFLGTMQDNQEDKIKKNRQSRLCGSKSGMAKLNEAQVKRIIADARYIKEIAKDYNMSFQMISRIKRREAWTHAL